MVDNAPFKVRFPPDLRAKLDVVAKSNKRSVTAEIVHRLEESFRRERQHRAQLLVEAADILDSLNRSEQLLKAEENRLRELKPGTESFVTSPFLPPGTSLKESITRLAQMSNAMRLELNRYGSAITTLAQALNDDAFHLDERELDSIEALVKNRRATAAAQLGFLTGQPPA
jgi:hypothetical protein